MFEVPCLQTQGLLKHLDNNLVNQMFIPAPEEHARA